MRGVVTCPEGFSPHQKVQKLFKNRVKMIEGAGSIDWGVRS